MTGPGSPVNGSGSAAGMSASGKVCAAGPCRTARIRVGEALEPAEGQETAGSLDGVDRAEDAAQYVA
ncbi:MAG TPA: hypothetical protein VIJ07_02625, partial [Dermatophilaceae bacterium]